MDIKDWIKKNSTLKDNVDIKELDGLIDDLNPIKNIVTKEEARAFIERNPIFKSAFDSAVSLGVETFSKDFNEKKMPAILREKEEEIRAELNPAETEEQKTIRELQEKDKLRDEKEQSYERKAELRVKAKELGYDPDLAERYSIFGEDALKIMESDFTRHKEYVDAELNRMSKEKFSNQTTPKRTDLPDDKLIKRDKFDQMGPGERNNFIKTGGVVVE